MFLWISSCSVLLGVPGRAVPSLPPLPHHSPGAEGGTAPRWWPWSHPVQVPAILLHLGFEERELGGFTVLVLPWLSPALCCRSRGRCWLTNPAWLC